MGGKEHVPVFRNWCRERLAEDKLREEGIERREETHSPTWSDPGKKLRKEKLSKCMKAVEPRGDRKGEKQKVKGHAQQKK